MAPAKRYYVPVTLTLFVFAMLLRFPPAQYAFYPQCPFYTWTHLLCPGCGATRALAALLRGHLAEAVRLNALLVWLAPFFLAYVAISFKRGSLSWFRPPGWALMAAFAITVTFTVARNISGPHP